MPDGTAPLPTPSWLSKARVVWSEMPARQAEAHEAVARKVEAFMADIGRDVEVHEPDGFRDLICDCISNYTGAHGGVVKMLITRGEAGSVADGRAVAAFGGGR